MLDLLNPVFTLRLMNIKQYYNQYNWNRIPTQTKQLTD